MGAQLAQRADAHRAELEQRLARMGRGADNLLDSPVAPTHPAEVWAERHARLGTEGIRCLKVARSGALYRRTFWVSGGGLRTDGHLFRGRGLLELTGVYKAAASSAFARLGSWSNAADQGACCVLTMPDHCLSLVFDTRSDR